MDFLVLFLLYLALVLTVVVFIYIYSRTPLLEGPVRRGAQVVSCIVPACVLRAGRRLLHYFFRTRNPTFVILHLTLQGLVYGEYSWEIIHHCQEAGFPSCLLLLPYLLLLVTFIFFTLTCVTDPGTITKANEATLVHVYEFDNVMFPKNVRCSVCDLRKLPLSKHCRVCNRCVLRFDHHCIWVNNCIGARNFRYFLVYLCALTASAATVASVGTVFLARVTMDLSKETGLDPWGRAADTSFLVQMLFLLFPQIVLVVGLVVVLSCILGGYLCFVLYLAATNQTTNQWYKAARLPVAKSRCFQNILSRGVWRGLEEPAFSATGHEKKKPPSTGLGPGVEIQPALSLCCGQFEVTTTDSLVLQDEDVVSQVSIQRPEGRIGDGNPTDRA
ncbi:PREDICTED: probable palmitoyltransferase ZDHHC4 [Elephantulus edwardii]|uniref:probable palmitoyltransferase ZDHHC4 n=1 Tax=Elephantulus edwardii TaxID=28737 RepID=UPI0003F0A3D1|nr:PREDICTED: probable palmitoyltransferase ZDHHC4 [Elephantulus edwardii]